MCKELPIETVQNARSRCLQVRSCLSVPQLRNYRMDFGHLCSWGLCTSISWKFYFSLFYFFRIGQVVYKEHGQCNYNSDRMWDSRGLFLAEVRIRCYIPTKWSNLAFYPLGTSQSFQEIMWLEHTSINQPCTTYV